MERIKLIAETAWYIVSFMGSTIPLINRPDIFNVLELNAQQEYVRENYRLTLDKEDDYKVFTSIYHNFKSDVVIDILKVYEYLDNNPKVYKINSKVIQKYLDKSIIENIDNFFRHNIYHLLEIKANIYNN